MRKSPIIIIVIIVFLLVVAGQSVFIVDETKQAIILQFGRHVRSITDSGLHLKLPFIQEVIVFENRVISSDAAPSEYITRDMKRVQVDHITRWRISDPHEFYKSVRTTAGAIIRLDDIVTGRLREEVARHDFIELIRDKREIAMENVTREARERADSLGIDILDTRIKRLDLPREVERSVFDRMEAERHRMAKRYRAEGEEQAQQVRAEADRDKEIILAQAYEVSQEIRGEGDARAAAVYADAYGQYSELYSFLKRLEVYEDIVPGSKIILSQDENLFNFLLGPSGSKNSLSE